MLKLWTLRPASDYEILQRDGVYRTKPECVDGYHLSAYHWISEQLAQKCPPPDGVSLPVWAWYYAHGSTKPKPDLRYSGFLPKGENGVRIEFNIPKEQVLLSNFDTWHCVLNDWCVALSDDEFDEYERLECSLPSAEFDTLKRQTWARIFDLTLIDKPEIYAIQAIFWELRLEWVTQVDFFRAR